MNDPHLYDGWEAASANNKADKLEQAVAALNQKIDRVVFEASAQIEELKAKVAALEGKNK